MTTVQQDHSEFNLLFVHSKVDEMGLDAYAFRIYAHLTRRANGKTKAWPGVESMAETCRMSRQMVMRCISELEAAQMIHVERKHGHANMYTLTGPTEWKQPEIITRPPHKPVHMVDQSTAKTPPVPLVDDHQSTEGTLRLSNEGNPKKGSGSSGPAPKPEPSNKREFTDGWCARFKKTFGRDYKFQGVKDGRAADSLLKLTIPPADLLAIAEKAWRLDPVRFKFERSMAIELSSFSSQLNRIQLAVGTLRPQTNAGILSRIESEESQAKRNVA